MLFLAEICHKFVLQHCHHFFLDSLVHRFHISCCTQLSVSPCVPLSTSPHIQTLTSSQIILWKTYFFMSWILCNFIGMKNKSEVVLSPIKLKPGVKSTTWTGSYFLCITAIIDLRMFTPDASCCQMDGDMAGEVTGGFRKKETSLPVL